MKKSFTFIVVISLIFVIIGCSSKSANIDIDKLSSKLLSDVTFEDQLTKLDKEHALNLYDVKNEDVTDAIVYIGTGATAEEISIWQCKDEKSLKTIKNKIISRVELQKKGYQDYKPSEVPKLENPSLTVKGNCIILCICKDTTKAQKVINKF